MARKLQYACNKCKSSNVSMLFPAWMDPNTDEFESWDDEAEPLCCLCNDCWHVTLRITCDGVNEDRTISGRWD